MQYILRGQRKSSFMHCFMKNMYETFLKYCHNFVLHVSCSHKNRVGIAPGYSLLSNCAMASLDNHFYSKAYLDFTLLYFHRKKGLAG